MWLQGGVCWSRLLSAVRCCGSLFEAHCAQRRPQHPSYPLPLLFFFFLNDAPPPEISPLPLPAALPIYPIGVDLDASLYALDSTTIDLCLSLFPWARFRQHKAAIKLHTLLD